MKEWKPLLYICFVLGLLIYAVPRLPMGQGMTAATLFSVAWLVMMLILLAAYLHELLGADEEARKEAARIKKMKRWQTEQWMRGKRKLLQVRK